MDGRGRRCPKLIGDNEVSMTNERACHVTKLECIHACNEGP